MPLKRKTESEENEGSLNLEDETSTSETATPVKKRPGRPRKPESEKKRKTPSGRSRGRPRIYPVVEKTPKLPRGRPKKSPGAERIIREKQRRGRPRILPFGSSNKRPKRVGRPRKYFSTENGEALVRRANKRSYTQSLTSERHVPLQQQNGSPLLPVVSEAVPQNVGRSRISLTAYHLVDYRNTSHISPQSELDIAIRKQFSGDCDGGLELLKKRFLAVSTQLIECEEDKLKLEKCMVIIKQKKLQLHRQFPAWRVNSLDLLKRKLLTMNAQLTEYEEQKLELEKRMIIIKQRKLQLERDILSYKPSVALDVGTSSASANCISVIVDKQALCSLPFTLPRCEVVLEKVAVANSVEQSGKSSGSSPRKRGRPSLKSSGDSTDDQEPVADSHCTVEQSENSSGSTPRKRGRPSLKPSGDSTDDQEPVTDNHCTVEQTEHSSGWSSPRKRGRPSLKPSGDSTDDQQNNSASVKRGRGRRGLNTSAKKEKKVTNQGDLGSKKKRGRRSKLDFSESVTITEESSDDMEEPSAELKE